MIKQTNRNFINRWTMLGMVVAILGIGTLLFGFVIALQLCFVFVAAFYGYGLLRLLLQLRWYWVTGGQYNPDSYLDADAIPRAPYDIVQELEAMGFTANRILQHDVGYAFSTIHLTRWYYLSDDKRTIANITDAPSHILVTFTSLYDKHEVVQTNWNYGANIETDFMKTTTVAGDLNQALRYHEQHARHHEAAFGNMLVIDDVKQYFADTPQEVLQNRTILRASQSLFPYLQWYSMAILLAVFVALMISAIQSQDLTLSLSIIYTGLGVLMMWSLLRARANVTERYTPIRLNQKRKVKVS